MLAKIATLALLIFPVAAQDAPDRRPGLIATAADASRSIEFIDTKIAGVWPDGHAPRHGLSNLNYSITWNGTIKIPREGKYRFSAASAGSVQCLLQNKPIFKIDASGSGESEWLQLLANDVAVELKLNKTGETGSSITFYWESEDFAKVTVPATAFFHDEKAETENVKNREKYENGSAIFENMRCGSCHERGDATKPLPGPNLKNVGSRIRQTWVFEYLKNPNAQRTGVEMPACFSHDDASAADRADVARYLGSLTSAQVEKKDKHRPNVEHGRKLFAFRGCVACHNSPEGELAPEEIPRAPLFTVGSKYINTNALADFIHKPLDAHPAGTMPDLRLSREESLDLASYVMKARDAKFEKELPAAAGSEADSVARGRAIITKKGCSACHEIEGNDKNILAAPSLQNGLPHAGDLGCASGVSNQQKNALRPKYDFSDEDAEALKYFLNKPAEPRDSESLTFDANRAITRFGCLQCHSRDGIGAGGELYELQKTAIDEKHHSEIVQVGPPDLTRAGEKLRPEWLRELFVSDTRARPWMQIKMPYFGAGAELFAKGLPALDGVALESPIVTPKTDVNAGLIGQNLIGKKGFNCIQCHDLAGSEANVAFLDARGPDLILSPGRIRYNWFRSWCVDPQALSPGTKMPTFFPGGATTLPGRHGLDGNGQILALYDYLNLGDNAPLPVGLANSKGWSWIVENRPAMVRTPFDEAPRAICIGFPGGVSIAYDAEKGKLIKVWKGGFLRMNGTQWTGQHGPYPSPEGEILWDELNDDKQIKVSLNDKQNKQLKAITKFLGYQESDGNVTFKKLIEVETGEKITIEETFAGVPDGNSVRLDHQMRVSDLPDNLKLSVPLKHNLAYGPLELDTTNENKDSIAGFSSFEEFRNRIKVRYKLFKSNATLDLSAMMSTPGKRALLIIAKGPKMEPLNITIGYRIGSSDKIDDPLTVKWPAAPAVDTFDMSPRVDPSFEGQEIKGKNPFALEEKSYVIESLPIPEDVILQIGGLDFLSNGSLVMCTRRGEVWILENATKTPDQFKWRRFAHGLHEPLGLKVVNDEIFVLQKPEITKLVDTNKDGVADDYQCYNAGWQLSTNFHEFAFGLEYHEGSFYGTLGLAIVPGGATRQEQVFARGSAWRVDPKGQFEVLALGLRTPNGVGLGANGEFYYTDNQGDYIPACKLQQVKKGEFYGQRFALPDRDAKVEVTPPTCWLPYNSVSESSSDVLLESQNGAFGPFAGQLLVGEFTNSRLLRVQLEKVKGNDQGTVWIFRRGFSSGLERIVWGPDGKLYAGCTTGGWGAVGPKLFSLERLSFNGVVPFEMKTVHLLKDGFEIEFTKPLAAPAAEPNNNDNDTKPYASIEQFHYHYWATYGSPEIDRKAHTVSDFKVSDDRRKVTFKVDGMVKDRICEIRLRNVTSENGEPLVHAEAWYTLNEFPD